jgi:hypothetical protein
VLRQPPANRQGNELWPMITADELGCAVHGGQTLQDCQDSRRGQRCGRLNQVLSGISSYETRILHTLYSDYLTQRHAKIAKLREWNSKRTEPYASSFFYRPHELLDEADVGVEEGEFLLDNLLQLGVLRFETPEVEDGEVQEPKFIHLTELSLKVLQACNSQPLMESGS